MSSSGFRILFRSLAALSVFFVVSSQTLMAAGTGTVRGRVFDKDTKDPLPGATIMVKGTSIGAASDLNGRYIIRNAPSGQQTLTISYIGYNSTTIDLNLPDNGDIEQDIYLEAKAITGQTVVVTAQAEGQVQAVNQQLSSNSIVNVVSAKKIQELPDFNAAEALGRLPGISVTRSSGEADKIVIRGLAPQFNTVAINGVTLGATDSTNRSVDLNQINPNMIKTIEVYKDITPDMDAEAIGGYVNMELNDAPSGLHTDLLWQSGYNKFRSKYSNYKVSGSVSDRFFGDQLGAYLLLSAEQVDRSSDQLSAGYQVIGAGAQEQVRVGNLLLNRHYESRNRVSGNLLMDYRLPNGRIVLSSFFGRLNPRTSDYSLNYYPPWNNAGWQVYNVSGGVSTNDLMTNSLEGQYDLGFLQFNVGAANDYVWNRTPSAPYIQFLQTNGWSPTLNAVIGAGMSPQTLVTYSVPKDSNIALAGLGNQVLSFKNTNQAYQANVKIPFVITSDASGFFKFGGKYTDIKRVNDDTRYYADAYYGGSQDVINDIKRLYPTLIMAPLGGASGGNISALNFTNPDPTVWENFLPDQHVGDLNWTLTLGYPNQVRMSLFDDKTNPSTVVQNQIAPVNGAEGLYLNDYTYLEKLSAGYGMAELDLGQQFMVVGGVRYENDANNITAYAVKQQSVRQVAFNQDTINAVTTNHFLLPMVQAKYKITDWLDVRYAYTQTLGRPDFTAMIPRVYISSNGGYGSLGNPFLVPARAYNHDVILSFYSNSIGLFTLDGFYKQINGFIYQRGYPLLVHPPVAFDSTTSTVGGYTLLQLGFAPGGATINDWVNNPHPAYLRGVETDFEHRFWYLPAPLNGLVLGVNYTHIWSNTLYPIIRSKSVGKSVIILPDSEYAGRLVQQPTDIFNGSIGYDLGGFSARVSFIYQGAVLTAVNSDVNNNYQNQSYFRADAAVRYLLQPGSILPGLQFYLNLNNLTARPDESNQVTKGFISYENFYGFTADLGVRYTL